MTSTEANSIWDRIDVSLKFFPSMDDKNFPGIIEPTPSITYDISEAYNIGELSFTEHETELVTVMLNAWRRCIPQAQTIAFLDWQHPCFWLNPHLAENVDPYGEYALPAFPNGDYYFFVTSDLNLGYFGHPWAQTICIWGQPLIDAFQDNLPRLFHQPLRQNISVTRF